MVVQCFLMIVLVVGEMFGDIFGVGLICVLKVCVFNVCFVGVVGLCMQVEGCEVWYEMEELVVMGIVEVFGCLCCLLYICVDLICCFIEFKFDVFVGIDVFDFNIIFEGNLKK